MDKIGFLAWSRLDDIASKGTRRKLKNFYKYAIQAIEKDINRNGGIAGKNIFIDFLDVPVDSDEAKKSYEDKIKNSPSILFAKGPSVFSGIREKKVEYIKTIESAKRLLFQNVAISDSENIELLKNNIDLGTSPEKTNSLPGDTFLRNKKFFNANRLFHFANIGIKSPVRLREEELLEKNIFLNFIDKEKDLIFEELEAKMLEALKDSTNKDMLSIGAMNTKLKTNVFNVCKKHNFPLKILFTNTANTSSFNFSDMPFAPIFQVNPNFDIYLKMEQFLEDSDQAFDISEKHLINDNFYQFEIPYLIKHVTEKHHISLSEGMEVDFIKKIKYGLNKIDGNKEIFVGTSINYAFKDQKNTLRKHLMVQALPSKVNPSMPVYIYHNEQLALEDDEYKTIQVTYVYLDILRINNISIEEESFSCDMYLDVISKDEDPIKTLRFNNLSTIDSNYVVNKVSANRDPATDFISTRYHLSGNFTFHAIASNYPFDSQYLYLAMTTKHGMLQPLPEELIDTDFDLNGWEIMNVQSGILRSKNYLSKSSTLERIAQVEEEVRVGWLIKRSSSMTVLKIGIPLFFLTLLVYYTLFLPIDELADAMAYLTTAFLSGIALYFSTERPQPLVMTTIDHIFAFFYFITGGSMVLVIFAKFLPEVYNFLIIPLRYLVPLSLIGFLVYLFRRVKTKKFQPNLLKS